MKEKKDHSCTNEMDMIHHLMEEQIAYICVKEEEEQIREGLNRMESHSEGY